MSGSCKHQKRCGLSWLRLVYIFLNKTNKKEIVAKLTSNKLSDNGLVYFNNFIKVMAK